MEFLKEQGFVEIARSGQITLTEEGRRRAEGIYERHLCITQFLMQVLGLDLKTADADACRIEHVISDESFLALKRSLGLPDEDVLWAEL